MAAKTLQRIRISAVSFHFGGRHETGPRAFRGKRTGGDGIEANLVLAPLHRERSGEREYACFRAGRRNNVAGAAIGGGVGGDDAENVAGLLRVLSSACRKFVCSGSCR